MCAAHSWRRSSASAKAHSRSCAESRPQLAISWLSRKQPIHTCASKKCALYRQMRMHGPLCPFPSSCLDSLGARARPSSALRTVARSRRHARRDRKFIAGDDGGSHAAPAAAPTIAPAASRTRVILNIVEKKVLGSPQKVAKNEGIRRIKNTALSKIASCSACSQS